MAHVLKASRARLDEPLQLSVDGTGRTTCDSLGGPAEPPRVRIAESGADSAVIEVVCPCGKVTHVRCEYAGATSAPVPEGHVQQ